MPDSPNVLFAIPLFLVEASFLQKTVYSINDFSSTSMSIMLFEYLVCGMLLALNS